LRHILALEQERILVHDSCSRKVYSFLAYEYIVYMENFPSIYNSSYARKIFFFFMAYSKYTQQTFFKPCIYIKRLEKFFFFFTCSKEDKLVNDRNERLWCTEESQGLTTMITTLRAWLIPSVKLININYMRASDMLIKRALSHNSK
jgi:hypothetical protein